MKRHDIDVFSLMAGLLFVAVAAAWALDRIGVLNADGRWILPAVLVAIGLIGLGTALPWGRKRVDGDRTDEAADR